MGGGEKNKKKPSSRIFGEEKHVSAKRVPTRENRTALADGHHLNQYLSEAGRQR